LTIAAAVDLVVCNATVTDDRGRPISGLTQRDFHVLEDHRAQDITLFSAEDVPVTVGLIIDDSSSMRDKRADVVAAALAFATASNAGDEMFVVHFNERPRLGLSPSIPFTHDPDEIRAALLQTTSNGLTALYDALAVGIDHVTTGTRDRKALVVLSDGGDNASHQRLEDVLRMAQQSSATIYTIGIYDDTNLDQNPGALRKVANLSGGRAYFPQALTDLDHVWRDVAGAIRSLYTIGYYSTNHTRDGKFRRVEIAAGRNGGKGLRVTTRNGYRAPVAKSTTP
jgi:Ca-activated chloride channel homolog